MLKKILFFTLLHFFVATAMSFLAFGTDLDQLSSRHVVSRVAAIAHHVLWYPHDATGRALQFSGYAALRFRLTLPLIIANSLLWGIALAFAWRLVERTRGPQDHV